jgi:hypothetical protein
MYLGLGQHKRGKDRYQSNLIQPVLIEEFHPAHVVQLQLGQPGFLFHLTQCSIRGLLIRLDVTVNAFPRAGTATGRPASEDQALETGVPCPEDIDVNQ